MWSRVKDWIARPAVASGWVLVVGLIGTAIYARVLGGGVYPIRQWLFWPLALVWGWVALFNAACASFGQMLLVRVLRVRESPALESAVFSMAVGVVAFVLAMYAGGACEAYSAAWALALPLVMLAAGARDGIRLARALVAEVSAPRRGSPLAILAAAFGVLCLGILYLQVMTPDSLNYDATWYHLTVAQDYARAGKIIAFPADYNRNFPQLNALIHTWGWLLPGTSDPLRYMLVLHHEFVLFLWTLAGISAGVRRLLDNAEPRATWAAFFLFPIIFVYDSNMGGSADHICGFFSMPILIAALRVSSGFARSECILFAVVCAGDMLTKYQAAYLIAPACAVLGVFWLRSLWARRADGTESSAARSELRALLLAPVLMLGVGVLVFSPHMIRNAIFYKNPLYPLMREVFPSTPNVPHSAFYFDNYAADPNYWVNGPALRKLANAIWLFFTFSFQPHYSFTNNVPAIGSLFTLLLPVVAVLPNRSRLLPALAIASGAVITWGYVYYVDRNLQTFMPVIACVTAAIIISAWQIGRAARIGLSVLIALQLVWGADAPFYSGHDRLRASVDLIRSGFDGRAETRFDSYLAPYRAMDKILPKNARVLIHTAHVSLGMNREVMLDWANYQSLISYAHIHTPRELFDYYRSLGITHLMYEQPMRSFAPSKQEEVVWNALVTGYAVPLGQFGVWRLVALPATAPRVEPAYRVASLGLWGYADGVYPVEAMHTIEYLQPASWLRFARPGIPMPADPEAAREQLEKVDAVFLAPKRQLPEPIASVLRQRFVQVLVFFDRYALYLRRDRVHQGH